MRRRIHTGKKVIADVAREAGVSVGTVSMALRNHPRIAEATRLSVHRTAARIGYTSPSQAHHTASLERGTLKKIGVIFFSNGTISPVISQLLFACDARNIRLEVMTANIDAHTMTPPQTAQIADLDAVILTDAVSVPFLESFKSTGVPFCILGRIHLDPSLMVDSNLLQVVATDDYSAGRQSTTWLIRNGHRRIAFYAGPILPGLFYYEWMAGYRTALADGGLDPGPIVTQTPPISNQEIGQALRNLLTAKERPTAFVVPGAILAERLHQEAMAVGLTLDPRAIVIGDELAGVHEKGFTQCPIADPDSAALVQAALLRLRQQSLGLEVPRGQLLLPYRFHNFGPLH